MINTVLKRSFSSLSRIDGRSQIVPPSFLEQLIKSKREFHLFDSTLDLKQPERPKKLFSKYAIEGAKYLDLFEMRYKKDNTLFPLPKGPDFNKVMSQHNMAKNSIVVFYDQQGMASAARGWYTSKCFGIENCFVLNGGLPFWIDEDKEIVR